jgi:hypothetical protein
VPPVPSISPRSKFRRSCNLLATDLWLYFVKLWNRGCGIRAREARNACVYREISTLNGSVLRWEKSAEPRTGGSGDPPKPPCTLSGLP